MTRKKFLVSVLTLVGAGLTIVPSLWKRKSEWTDSPHEVRLWYCYSKDDGTWSDPVPFEEEPFNFNINN